ncbi:fungal-specific transcription factor domain-containing protein [Mycena alexandri]|uniref:Fungal-specific transcription factor domain-containing protein n=1 Tax=Mycena alexandri TaxID=1745969 RepID=A0AAD6X708_9AGAR|nr:fungal-specific transcription factor domain-containing protein [Mycena alexandri]
MSDNEHFEANGAHTESARRHSKQRRPDRSCDICRKKKTRCDGVNMPNRCCSTCVAFGTSCTYVMPSRTRGPKNAIMEELKKENESLKAQLRNVSICSLCAQPLHSQASSASVLQHASLESDVAATLDLDAEEDLTGDALASRFRQFSIKNYFNSTGSFEVASGAMAMKEQYTGKPMSPQTRRSLYWDILPWEKERYTKSRTLYLYPDRDLIASLLRLYFDIIHPTVPILHRPSFEKSVADGLHLTDMEFGGLLLSVLATASRYSDDPRVFVEGDASLSSGWKFANQVKIARNLFEPTIYELQMYYLMAYFALGTSFPQVAGLYLGLGIHFLQLRREYRQKREGQKLNFEEELGKRIFWCYVSLDRMASLFHGRPTTFHIERYDVDLTVEVDDEYWDRGFVQPLGTPPLGSYFVCHSRLCEILGDAMRRLYGPKKTKAALGWSGPEWEQRTVAELDSAINDFIDSIPPHLRWNSDDPPQGAFFDQSATLYITYQLVQITIHRPFIHRLSTLAAPSLSICTRAARSILHTVDIWLKKLHRVPLPNIIDTVFLSGLILVLSAFGTKRAGLPIEMNKDLAQVETALKILKISETRWQPAGRRWELLRDLRTLDPVKLMPNDSLDDAYKMGRYGSADQLYPQQRFQPSVDLTSPALSLESGLQPGVSIEQLLADTLPADAMDGILDEELMSMWMNIPADVTNVDHWDAYFGDKTGVDAGQPPMTLRLSNLGWR